MNLSEVKLHLKNASTVAFTLPDGSLVPGNCDVTEIGKITKDFIEGTGTTHKETVATLRLRNTNDGDYRLTPEKMLHMIQFSQEKLGLQDSLEVDVEYQGITIGNYGLGLDGTSFVLISKTMDGLPKEPGGIPSAPPKIKVKEFPITAGSSCSPGSEYC